MANLQRSDDDPKSVRTSALSSNASDERSRPAAARVASVDALRGLTILLMVFVNDLGRAAPKWLHHIQPPNADGMTLADVVFPMFLFIVGVSIPLAFERAREEGKSIISRLFHIFTRTLSLLLMGVISNDGGADRRLGAPLWELLAYISIILAWCVVPKEHGFKRRCFWILKAVGVVGLIALTALFKSDPRPTDVFLYGRIENWTGLQTSWWGILGLIGWAYLTVALVTLVLGRRRERLVGAMWLLIIIHIALHQGGLLRKLDDKSWLAAAKPALHAAERALGEVGKYVSFADATGSLAAISMAGCVLGSILARGSDVSTHKDRITWCLTFTIALFVAGCFTDSFEGINKIAATPAWCFLSASASALIFLLLYLLMDVARLRGWAFVIRPAGANPLVAYFLHPIAIWSVTLAGFGDRVFVYKNSLDPRFVVAGSLCTALFVCLATGLLGLIGLRTKL